MKYRVWKRVLSAILIATLVVTLFPNLPMKQVEAAGADSVISIAEGEYPYSVVSGGTSKYAKFFNKSDAGGWCALFVAYCMKKAGVSDRVYNYRSGLLTTASPSLVNSGKFYYRCEGKTPKKGDTIYFDWGRSGLRRNIDHVGFVINVKGGRVYTIEGNSSNAINYRNYYLNDTQIVGFASIDYSGNSPAIPEPSRPEPFEGTQNVGASVASSNPDDYPVPTVTMSTRYNRTNYGVRWVQAILKKFVNGNIAIDGIYGTNTANAVRTFQRANGLSVDGVTGPNTIASMKNMWNATKVVNPTSININPTSLVMTKGRKSGAISANVGPSNASNKTVSWTTNNSAVATVNNGVVTAVNEGTAVITAKTSNGKTASCTVTVHNPCVITFVNDDGSVLSSQTIDYGASASAPKNPPEKKGYTFAGWSGTYQNVKADATVTATYNKNVYKVAFKETDGTPIGAVQNISYDEPAIAPDVTGLSIPDGYTFAGWSENFDHVTCDMTIYPIYKWADEELPIVVSTDENSCKPNYDNGTYALTFTLTNHSEQIRKARVMTYMITNSGKMVAQGETRTVVVPAAADGTDGSLKVSDMYVVCANPADMARIVVLDDYESAVPLAEVKDVAVEAAGYGEWTDKAPTSGQTDYNKRTLYRSKNVKYTTSTTASTISGWTKYNTTYVDVGNGDKLWYASGRSATAPAKAGVKRYWAEPIVFAADPSIYTVPTYNISISTTGGDTYRSMVRWIQASLCRLGYPTSIDGVYGSNTASVVKLYQRDHGLSADGIFGTQTRNFIQNILNTQSIYNYYYESCTRKYTYYFYQVDSSWSGWKTDAITGDKTVKPGTTKRLVETKKQYRYKEYVTEDSGTTVTPKCSLPENAMSLAGKEAVVIVFKNKVNQIAEDNVEYIGNTTIGKDGKLNISFIPREEQTYETGDYTIALGVKGTSNYVTVGVMEAPKPTYKVTFVNADGTEISSQEVVEGHDAEVPESPVMDGYNFTGWDTGVTNVHADLTITAQYEKQKHTVTYVDWQNQTIESQTYEHGDVIGLLEEPKAPEGMEFVSWGVEDNLEVTEDIICEAEYKKQELTVSFVDWGGNVVIEETIEYGDSAVSPEVVEEGVTKDETVPEKIDGMSFVGWGEDIDLSRITTNLVVGAIYKYDETVDTPQASVHSGEYDSSQIVELTTETKDTIIYYTLDGSDPTDVENAEAVKVYDGPITIDNTTKLKYYAVKMGMNDSSVDEEWYCINKTGNKPMHLLNIQAVNVYNDEAVSGYINFVDDGKLINTNELFTSTYDSVELEGIYYNEEFTEKWQEGSQTITESLELYAKYDAKKFTVTYLNEDGTVYKTGTVNYGSPIPEEEAIQKDGYRFTGWVSEDDVDFVTKDITVTPAYVTADKYALVKFTRNSYSVMEGSVFKLSPKVTYEVSGDTTDEETLQFSSSDDNFATVDEMGNVTALAKGEVTITVEVLSSGEMAECKLNITGNPETSVCLYSNSSYKLQDGYLRNIEIGKNTVAEVKKQINAENIKFLDNLNCELKDNELVGTGTHVQLLNENGDLLDEVQVVLTGDYNGDGIVNGKDVSGVTRCLLGKETADNIQLMALDVNGDGNVNNRDASMLARYLVGKEAL